MNFEEFVESLNCFDSRKILFVALGNELRGDDAISFYFHKKLKETKQFANSKYLNAGANPENYLSKIIDLDSDLIIFIDSAKYGGRPGEISWLDNKSINNINISTHAFSIKLVEDFILSEMDTEIKYLGIEPIQTDFGKAVSPKLLELVNSFFFNPHTKI